MNQKLFTIIFFLKLLKKREKYKWTLLMFKKKKKELGNNNCLNESCSVTYTRKSLSFSMAFFSKGRLNTSMPAVSVYLYLHISV